MRGSDPIDCELCVSAIDARQRELFTCVRLEQSGVLVKCRECKPLPYVVPPLEYIPVDRKEVVVRHGWDKVEQLNDHFKKALAAMPAKKG